MVTLFSFRRSRSTRQETNVVASVPSIALQQKTMLVSAELRDVADLIAKYSVTEHVARADAYFTNIPNNNLLLQKPFFGIQSTQANMSGIAEVLERLNLFPAARVLDFGAGTGWFSRILALIGCRPIATDVSAKALSLGQKAFARDPLSANLTIDWKVFDGLKLPLETESVDRVLCFDSFHHVPNQNLILREFYRVLIDGGRVVFHEPGPSHSLSPAAQFEMRHHDVIENNIIVENIWAAAAEIGFSDIEMTLARPSSLSVSLNEYTRVITGAATNKDVSKILDNLSSCADNLRVFVLKKGEEVPDSRHGPAGLGGTFDLTLNDTTTDILYGWIRVTNTGSKPWRASDGQAGSVSLGIRLMGVATSPDVGRISLSNRPVLPGETLEQEFALNMPIERPARLQFDLVAEMVTWFELVGSKPVFVELK